MLSDVPWVEMEAGDHYGLWGGAGTARAPVNRQPAPPAENRPRGEGPCKRGVRRPHEHLCPSCLEPQLVSNPFCSSEVTSDETPSPPPPAVNQWQLLHLSGAPSEGKATAWSHYLGHEKSGTCVRWWTWPGGASLQRWHQLKSGHISLPELSVLDLGLLLPSCLLHQTIVCLFHGDWAHWFVCACVPSAPHTTQHTAGVSVGWSQATRRTQGRETGGHVQKKPGDFRTSDTFADWCDFGF